QLRPRLLRMLGEYGADAKARQAARAIAARFLANPGSVDVDLAREALRVSAMHDDGGLYDDYIAAYRKAGTAAQRSAVLQSVYFDDPDIVRQHLDFLLTAEVAAGDALQSVSLYATTLADNSAVYAWLDENLDALMAKIPDYYHPQLPQAFGGGCSEAGLERLNRFFADRDGFAASLGRANEAARACIAASQRYRPALENFLARY
ncbi:MAG: ERAP1-like C-terminal domain-containing protein, partial [Woeseiaceae bacterium]|nr:ERAP1-like C-terminal domain-containing protein [Woeseiaceae bacterium]